MLEQARVTASDPVILVHGYNVDRYEAHEGFVALFRTLRDVWKLRPQELARVYVLYWDGYLPRGRLGLRDRLVSPFTYPSTVPIALRTGERLGSWLRPRLLGGNAFRTVALVGHSLGCRVVLETLRVLEAALPKRSGRVPSITLMAAAVPIEMLGGTARLNAGTDIPARTLVLASGYDRVLQVFPAGQWLAFEPSSEAVGVAGQPFERWDERKLTRYGHGDYFSGAQGIDAIASATNVTPRVRQRWPHEIPVREVDCFAVDSRRTPDRSQPHRV